MEHAKPLTSQMLDLIDGYWISKMIHVIAEVNVADALRDGPRSPADLACYLSLDADRLYLVLRALAGVGLFLEDAQGHFALTPLGETLRTDRPDSMRAFARMMPASYNWRAWDELASGVTSKTIPFETAFGKHTFEYLAEHSADETVFAEAMTSVSGAENPAVTAAIDLDNIETLVDLGGSAGHLLASVLAHHEGVRGVLFDQPQVVEVAKAAPFLSQPGVAERVTYEGGDFFTAVPAGLDGYMMKYILHDWNDDQCEQILRNCREAMAPGGRVFVVDNVIHPGNDLSWGKLLDINMLVLTGGSERTEAQFAVLFERAGLRLDRVIPTACPLSIVVGVAL